MCLVPALANSGVEKYDIPAFLRKQADQRCGGKGGIPYLAGGECRLSLLRQTSRGVEYPQDFDRLAPHPVRNDIACFRHDQFKALRGRLTRIHLPFPGQRRNVFVTGEVSGIGLPQRGADFADLPLVRFGRTGKRSRRCSKCLDAVCISPQFDGYGNRRLRGVAP